MPVIERISCPFKQIRDSVLIQRQPSTSEEEDQSGEVLTGGLGIVASEALEHEPLYNFLDAHLFSYLKHTFWEDRPDAEKALIVGHSVLTLAPLGTVFSIPQGRETFSGVVFGCRIFLDSLQSSWGLQL
jgi:hypothetical protein